MFSILIADPFADIGDGSAADLLFSIMGTLEVTDSSGSWIDQGFPVLEMAVHLASREGGPPGDHVFTSMLSEDGDFELSFRFEGGRWVVSTPGGQVFHATDEEFQAAVRGFLESVDRVVLGFTNRSLNDVRDELARGS